MLQYDPLYGYYDDEQGSINGPTNSASAPQPGAGGVQPGATAPFVQPSLDPNASEFHGFDYWQGQGVDPASMFGPDGQLLPAWQHTANGYKRADAAPPAPTLGTIPFRGGGSYAGGDRPSYNLPNAPKFDFKGPSLEEAQAEPGYEFGRSEGVRGLEQSASGRGVLRTGGTLKDIVGWGNKFATQNFGNVYDRRFREAQAAFEPVMADYVNRFGAEVGAGNRGFDRSFDLYRYDNDSARDLYKYDNDAAFRDYEAIMGAGLR